MPPTSRSGCSACGSTACGCMSEPPTRCTPRKRRFCKAWRDAFVIAGLDPASHRLKKAFCEADGCAGHPARRRASRFCPRMTSCDNYLPRLPPASGPCHDAAQSRIRKSMRVFSVPVSVPFLRSVIAALIDGRLVRGFEARTDPSKLAQATLYLPTRRAGRMAREIFLDELNTGAVLLPRIVALGDIDEDELAFAEESEQYGGAAPLDIPPKLGELDRRLTLARLVAAWAKSPVSAPLVVGGPASTLALAGDLARLMDDMVTRGVGWEALDGLVPDQLDQYWQHSFEFLQIARKMWPAHLTEIAKIEPAARRDLLIE